MRDLRVGALAPVLLLLAVGLGCGSGSSNTITPPPEPYFLYVVDISGAPTNPSSNLGSFKIDPANGKLSLTSTIPLSQVAPGLAVDAPAKTLYVSVPTLAGNFISLFSIDAQTGVPTSNGLYNLTALCAFCPPQSGPGQLALNPTGKFLYYGSSTLGASVTEAVGALDVDGSTGALSQVSGSPFLTSNAALFVAVHPSGNFLYTEDIDKTGANFIVMQSLSAFSIDSTSGALTPVPGSPFIPPLTAHTGGFAIDPEGKFLYASTGLAGNGILGWSIDTATGAITPLPGSPFQAGTETFGAAFDASGKFFYVSPGSAGGLLGFSVDPVSGDLIPLAGSPFASTSFLLGPTIDPDGKFLFTADPNNNAIVGFKLNSSTGALTPLGNSTSIGGHPGVMTIIKAP